MKLYMYGAGIASLLAFAGASSAGTIVQSGSLGMTRTNWSESFQIDKFDDLGGTRHLDQVIIEMVGGLDATVGVENRDSIAKVVSVETMADFTLMLEDEVLATSSLELTEQFSLAAFDGTIDFQGASGAMIDDLSGVATDSSVFNSQARDMSAWTGTGSIELLAFAFARSFATGGGNVTYYFETHGAIDFSVTYLYSAIAVPTPTAAVLGFAGLAGLTGGRRRR